MRGSLTAAAGLLDEIADALDQARPVRAEVLAAARRAVRATIERLEGDSDAAGGPDPPGGGRPAARAVGPAARRGREHAGRGERGA